jgi:lysophospholipase L1-like esterase
LIRKAFSGLANLGRRARFLTELHSSNAAAIVAVAVSLSACGGGGPDSAPSTPPDSGPPVVSEPSPPPPPPCKATVTVQLFGDSTQNYAFEWGFLRHELDSRFGPGRVVLQNNAVSGTDSLELYAGADTLNPPWPQGVTADIAMVNHGINDNAKGRPLAGYIVHMRAFARGNGSTRMVIETPNPIAAYRGVPADAPFAQAGRDAAALAGVPVADVQAYVLSLPDWESLTLDGVHPSPELARAIARDVTAPTLAPIIDSMICH